MTHHRSHNGSILLFYKTLIRFETLTSSGEGDLFGFTIAHQKHIDKFASIIDIQPQDRKRKECSRLLEGRENRLWVLREQGKTFGPPGCHVGESQRVEGASLALSTRVGHQIGFEKTRPGVIPLLEGPDGNLAFEQVSSLRGGTTARSGFVLGTQEALSRARAHRQQLTSALLAQMQMSLPLQGCHQRGQKGDQAFGTDMLGGFPELDQSLLYVRGIA